MKPGLRWVAVLPVALLAAVLSALPLHWALYQTLTGSGFIEPYPETPERVLLPLVAAMAFVWYGTRVAPSHKIETAVVLFGVWLMALGAAIALWLSGFHTEGLQITTYGGWLGPASGLIGAVAGLCFVRNRHAAVRSDSQIVKAAAPPDGSASDESPR